MRVEVLHLDLQRIHGNCFGPLGQAPQLAVVLLLKEETDNNFRPLPYSPSSLSKKGDIVYDVFEVALVSPFLDAGKFVATCINTNVYILRT